jgi:trigger factor
MRSSMQVTVESLSDIKKKLNFEIPADRVGTEIDKAFEAIRKRADIKGFRKGKAPRSYIEKHFSAMMEQDVLKSLVKDTYFLAIQKEKLFPVALPVIESDDLKKGEPFKYSATIEVYPEVKIKEFAGLEVIKEQHVEDEEIVGRRLEEMQENMAQLKPVDKDRPVALGDFLTIDFKGFIDGAPFENGSAEDFHLELGKGRFIPGFEEQIVSQKIGEEKSITVTFPEDYGSKELAGKEATFNVTVKEIKVKELPLLDDEFARGMGEFETLDQLRAKIKEVHERQEKDRIEADLRDRTIKAFIKKNPFEVPDSLVEKQVQIMLDSTKKRLALEKLSLEMMGLDDTGYKTRFRDTAEIQVKGALLLDALAAQEGITVEESELDAKIREIAEQRNQQFETLKQFYEQNENARDNLTDQLKENKVFAFLLERANISEIPKENIKEELQEK